MSTFPAVELCLCDGELFDRLEVLDKYRDEAFTVVRGQIVIPKSCDFLMPMAQVGCIVQRYFFDHETRKWRLAEIWIEISRGESGLSVSPENFLSQFETTQDVTAYSQREIRPVNYRSRHLSNPKDSDFPENIVWITESYLLPADCKWSDREHYVAIWLDDEFYCGEPKVINGKPNPTINLLKSKLPEQEVLV